MKVRKQVCSEWCLLLALLLAFPAAAKDVAPDVAPIPASAPSKEATRQGKISQPQATPTPTDRKQTTKSGRENPPASSLPASELGMGCAEEKKE
jgi:hypothetical protein